MTKNNYALPNFLVKGFASRISDTDIFTLKYHKQNGIFETNITHMSDEYYHSTENVNELVYLLDQFREVKDGSEVSNPKVSELIMYLYLNINHFRSSAEVLLQELSAFLLNINNLKTFILNNFKWIKEQLQKTNYHNPTFKLYKDTLLQLEAPQFSAFLDKYKSVIEKWLQNYIISRKEKLLKLLNGRNINLSTNAPNTELQIEQYHSLRWFIYESPYSLILGDVGYLFETTGAKTFTFINEKHDEIKRIFLPISSNRMLIGTWLSYLPQFDFNFINQVTAKCSREFFICSEHSADKNHLISYIGKESTMVSRDEMEWLLKELARDFVSSRMAI